MAGVGFDLLSLLPGMGQQEAAPAAEPTSVPAAEGGAGAGTGGWSAYLSNPANRAFLISAGLQMATGGWGSPLQQTAQALGKGFEAQSGTEQLQYEQGEKDRETARRSAEAEAGRKTQVQVANIGAASRKEIAAARNEGLMQREVLRQAGKTSTTKTPDEQKFWDKIYADAQKNAFLTQEDASAVADRALEARRQKFGGNAPPATGGGDAAAPAAPGTPASAAPAKKTSQQIEQDWAALQAWPGFAAAMADKEQRMKLMNEPRYAHLRNKIAAMGRSQDIEDTVKNFFNMFKGGGGGGSSPPANSIPGGTP